MADRLVKVLENGRLLTRGCADMDGYIQAFATKDESLTITFEWANWLGSNTIASALNESHGVSTGAITTDGTQTSFTVSDCGLVQHRITDSAGQTKEVRLRVRSPGETGWKDYRG